MIKRAKSCFKFKELNDIVSENSHITIDINSEDKDENSEDVSFRNTDKEV